MTTQSLVALTEMLARPDPPDLPPRRHRVTRIGKPDRVRTQLPRLVMAYGVWRIHEAEEKRHAGMV